MGIAYGMKGNLDKALELNQRVLELDANNAKAALNIAITYQGMGNKEKADFYFQKAFTLDPKLKR
ncbi:MAG: tetratricopeptide repeat protein [Sphingobacteriales bacterium]|nr:tetratricopeptide repeat protein [Sphingobacteriales bacterium]